MPAGAAWFYGYKNNRSVGEGGVNFPDEFGEVAFYSHGGSAFGDVVVTRIKDNGLGPVPGDDAVDEEVNVVDGRTAEAPVYDGKFREITGGLP